MSEETVGGVLRHKDTRNVQVRLDYMLLYRNETKAKVIRIMETWTAQKKAEWYKQSVEAKEQKLEPPEEELWVTMSYKQFSLFAYGTKKHDNIKQNVDDLVKEKHLQRRPHPTIPYGPPQYLLNLKLLQKMLDEQEIPSLVDDIGKIAPPRKKHTPPEKYPQGRGINHRGDPGKIPPGTGENSYPSNNTTENTNNHTENKDDIATSLQEDRNASAATIHDIEVARQRKTDPRIPAVSSHSQVDIGNEETVKMPAVKIGENNGRNRNSTREPHDYADSMVHSDTQSTPRDQNRTTSAQQQEIVTQQTIPAGPPADAAQRTALPQGGAVQASIPKRPRGKKPPVLPDEQPQPKCDTREIQRRINEHRGYMLEEKVEVIRERQAIKTWCNLHTLEEYGLVMAGAKNDKYWGKTENYYRIGGLTLLKITPEILARQRQPLQLVANGHNGHSNQDGLVYQGDLVLWNGQWMTEEEADKTGFNGGFGLYK